MFNRRHKLLCICSGIILLFIVLPLLITLITSFGKPDIIQFPIHSFSLKWYGNVFNQVDIISGIETSGEYALLACLSSLIIGLPAVYAMTRYHIVHEKWFQSVFLSSVFLPEVVMGFALYNFMIMTLHVSSQWVLFIGYFALSLPFVIRFISAGMLELNLNVEKAAWICGSTRLKSFFKVVVPSLVPYITASLVMGFMNSFNSLTISIFLTGPDMSMLLSALYNYIQQNDDPTISAVSVLLMIATVVIMVIIDHELGLNKLIKRGK